MAANISDYTREEVCVYKGRRYYVRDNGAIYRQCKEDGVKRKWDEEWTFGKFDPKTGYMLIGQERVHRIVCTAYHGEPVGDKNVVDHIDTNRCNNRPDNLRWVTRMENILNNPITMAKVELICGSREAFIASPSLLFGHESEDPNFMWMRNVSPDEAKASYERWKAWAAKPIEERNPKGRGVGEWIYDKEKPASRHSNRPHYVGPYDSWSEHKAAVEEMNIKQRELDYGLKDSLTPGAKQLDWKTPTEFLLCPMLDEERTLECYLGKLEKGKPFLKNTLWSSEVQDAGINHGDDALYVLTHQEKAVKPWAICRITYQDDAFIHESYGTYFKEDGGLKYFTIALGKEWTGGDVFDDFC